VSAGTTPLLIYGTFIYYNLMAQIRAAIENDTFLAYRDECLARWQGNEEVA
jgi:queuine/archaeosine tRNA-ribosyltransferase